MNRSKAGLTALVAMMVTIASLSAASVPASASPSKASGLPILWNQNGKTVPVNYCPNYSNGTCSVQYWERNGTNVTMDCWRDTNLLFPGNYKSVRWFYVSYKYGRWSHREGWVHSSYVYYQTTVPRC